MSDAREMYEGTLVATTMWPGYGDEGSYGEAADEDEDEDEGEVEEDDDEAAVARSKSSKRLRISFV